jgi:nucleotidyltransferase/DNA polymerase involved in DNA repair
MIVCVSFHLDMDAFYASVEQREINAARLKLLT